MAPAAIVDILDQIQGTGIGVKGLARQRRGRSNENKWGRLNFPSPLAPRYDPSNHHRVADVQQTRTRPSLPHRAARN